MEYSVIFVFGLIVGSFLNAVIYRLWVGQSVAAGRSYCPECKHVLAPRDLVPLISFMILRAKCRYCRKPISWQYPSVELATAIAFVLSFATVSMGGPIVGGAILRLLLYWIYSAFLVIIFVYDLKHYLILDIVIIPAVIIAFIGGMLLGYPIMQMLLAGIAAAGFFAIQFFVSRGRWIGGGDIRLGFLMGLMLSWPLVVAALMFAYVLGSIIGIGLILAGKKKLGSQVPFGTFLTIATFITLLYGNQLAQWYWSTLYV